MMHITTSYRRVPLQKGTAFLYWYCHCLQAIANLHFPVYLSLLIAALVWDVLLNYAVKVLSNLIKPSFIVVRGSQHRVIYAGYVIMWFRWGVTEVGTLDSTVYAEEISHWWTDRWPLNDVSFCYWTNLGLLEQYPRRCMAFLKLLSGEESIL